MLKLIYSLSHSELLITNEAISIRKACFKYLNIFLIIVFLLQNKRLKFYDKTCSNENKFSKNEFPI